MIVVLDRLVRCSLAKSVADPFGVAPQVDHSPDYHLQILAGIEYTEGKHSAQKSIVVMVKASVNTGADLQALNVRTERS